MPQLVVTSSSVVPPASAFQSPIRILKRTAAPTQKYANDDSSASSITGSFAERSARYNAARERIFADMTEGSTGGAEGGAVATIVRNPKGPEYAQGPDGQDSEGSQGFGMRVGKRGSTSQLDEKPVTNSRED
jgi:SUZ domain